MSLLEPTPISVVRSNPWLLTNDKASLINRIKVTSKAMSSNTEWLFVSTRKVIWYHTVEPPLPTTSRLQRPRFFVPANKKSIHWLLFNPFTARVFDGVLWGDFNFWFCRQNPMMWPFKWKLSACTYTWCYLLFKISQNKIWKFGRNLLLAKFGSERVKELFFTVSMNIP